MIDVRNVIAECDDGKPAERDLAVINTLAYHRVGIDKKYNLLLGLDAVTICQRFIHDPEVAKYTGAEVAYTFLIGGADGLPEHDGVIWQCLPVADIGRHAGRWNIPAIGVGCIGDFRVDPPSKKQRASAIRLGSFLEECFGKLDIRGHDELAGGSSDPNKKCPGAYFNMSTLRTEIRTFGLVELVGARLAKGGIVV